MRTSELQIGKYYYAQWGSYSAIVRWDYEGELKGGAVYSDNLYWYMYSKELKKCNGISNGLSWREATTEQMQEYDSQYNALQQKTITLPLLFN